MRIEEGPALGAVIIGSGVAFLLYQRNQNLVLSLAIGLAVAVADYFLVLAFRSFGKKLDK